MEQTLLDNLPQKMNLISDLFSRVVFRDRDACQDLVRIVLGREFTVTSVMTQYDITNLQFHSVVLDVLAETSEHKPVHIEFQIHDQDDHLRRVRYYNGCIDTHTLRPGQKYCQLPDVYHIYITMNDFIGGGQTVYEIHRTFENFADAEQTPHNRNCSVENGVHEIYINLAIPLKDDSELEHLLKYMKNTTKENERESFSHIVNSVNQCRKDGDAMKYYNSEEFFDEGVKEGCNSIIRNMLAMKQSFEFISQCTSQPVEYIEQIAREMPQTVCETSTYKAKTNQSALQKGKK